MDKRINGHCPATIAHPELYEFPEKWTEAGLCEERFAESIKKVQSWLDNRYSPVDSLPTPIASSDGSLPELDDGEDEDYWSKSTLPFWRNIRTYSKSRPKGPLDLVETHQSKKPEEKTPPCPQPDKEELRFNMKLRQLRERQNNQDKKQQPQTLKRRCTLWSRLLLY
jgi:hypothetical protein